MSLTIVLLFLSPIMALVILIDFGPHVDKQQY